MKPYTIDQLHDFAKEKGGECLAPTYEQCKQKILWRCKEGHQWESTWDCIKHNSSWCPTCVGLAKPPIEKLQQHAMSKGGILISSIYENNRSKLIWECVKGHRWSAIWANTKNGKWCPKCSGRDTTMEELQIFAKEKGGSCLSQAPDFETTHSNLLWKCAEGHEWMATWHSIHGSRKSWCPMCSKFRTEKKCRILLEGYLGFSLPKIRFTHQGKKYEWDGYNLDRKIAFEYHGEQHYKRHRYFHKEEGAFERQQKRDREKETYAKENGITLIVIPFSQTSNLSSYLKDLTNSLQGFSK